MLEKEQSTYLACKDYLGSQSLSALQVHQQFDDGQAVIKEADRTKLVDWCYKVIDLFKLEREVVAMAMNMVDRFLSKSDTCDLAYKALYDRFHFQLLTMTALYVVIKTKNMTVIGSKLFSIISCDLYSISDIEAMEWSLLQGLSWYISAPTSVQIANYILKVLSTHPAIQLQRQTWAAILNEVHYQSEHAVRDYHFVTQRPSSVAVAAIFNAIDLIELDHVRQAFHACLLIYLVSNQEKYDSIWQILDSKHRLKCLVTTDHVCATTRSERG